VAEAVTAYEAALAREATVPNVLTQAYSELPYLIATHRIREQYARALELLHLHESRLTFPVDRFRWHAAFALIAADTHEAGNASIHARQALAAAALARSGFRHHPSFGLVRVQNADIIKRLEALSATDPER
jgi:hypothetical protein